MLTPSHGEEVAVVDVEVVDVDALGHGVRSLAEVSARRSSGAKILRDDASATRFRTITMMIRTKAAPQAVVDGSAAGVARVHVLCVDEHRQRWSSQPSNRFDVDAGRSTPGDQQQRRRLADDPGDGEGDAGQRCRADRRREDDLARSCCHFGTPSAYAASRSSFGHEHQHLLGRPDDDRGSSARDSATAIHRCRCVVPGPTISDEEARTRTGRRRSTGCRSSRRRGR